MSTDLSIEDIKKHLLSTECPIKEQISKLEHIVKDYVAKVPIEKFELIDYSRMNSNDMAWITEKHKESVIKQNMIHMINSPIVKL